jgi:iron complex transport system ATP-binding protein
MIVMTEDYLVQDQPCNLIIKGVFDTLFKDENIKFDSEKGRFMIR